PLDMTASGFAPTRHRRLRAGQHEPSRWGAPDEPLGGVTGIRQKVLFREAEGAYRGGSIPELRQQFRRLFRWCPSSPKEGLCSHLRSAVSCDTLVFWPSWRWASR